MKYNANLWTELTELKEEPKEKEKDLYIRFSITGWKVTISTDLREGLLKDFQYIKFLTHKVIDEKKGNRADGTPFYKNQYLGISGESHDGITLIDHMTTKEIKIKGKDEDTNKYYYVNLNKALFAQIDKSLINTTSFVSSRQYRILEESINYENSQLIIDMENRSKKVFSVGYKNGYNKNGKIEKGDTKNKKNKKDESSKDTGTTMKSIVQNEMGIPQLK